MSLSTTFLEPSFSMHLPSLTYTEGNHICFAKRALWCPATLQAQIEALWILILLLEILNKLGFNRNKQSNYKINTRRCMLNIKRSMFSAIALLVVLHKHRCCSDSQLPWVSSPRQIADYRTVSWAPWYSAVIPATLVTELGGLFGPRRQS